MKIVISRLDTCVFRQWHERSRVINSSTRRSVAVGLQVYDAVPHLELHDGVQLMFGADLELLVRLSEHCMS